MNRTLVYSIIAASIILGSLGIWLYTRDTLPSTIKIATGHKDGMYHHLGTHLQEKLESRTKSKVEIVETDGTPASMKLLQDHKVNLAFLQSIFFPDDNVFIITPLYLEPVVILAKKELKIKNIFELENRRICIGPKDSGMAKTSEMLLKFYGLEVDQLHTSFDSGTDWDAAIVTSGLLSPTLQRTVQTVAFDIIELSTSKALTESNPFIEEFTIPEGIFARNPSLPSENLQTIAYTALLAVNKEKASSVLINETLDAIYTCDICMEFPMLMSLEKIREWSTLPLHSTAKEYFNPDYIEVLATFLESLLAIKELLFAFIAAAYFLWLRFDKYIKRQETILLAEMKEQLDVYLQVTINADRDHIPAESQEELQRIMNSVTQVKIKALEELTHEKLRSDQMFSIFLMQCHDVISKIQKKMGMYS